MEYISERSKFRIKGDIWVKLGKNLTREQVLEYPDRAMHNLIVDIASDQIAEWAIAGSGPVYGAHAKVDGIMTLAVGTGAVGWDLQNPPAETAGLTVLFSELTRKIFAASNYVDNVGSPSVTRTNIVDYLTTFLESEAVGPLVEMGLFAGTGATSAGGGTRINARHFPVINKPATSQISVLYRLTF